MYVFCPSCFEQHVDGLDMCPHCGYVDGDHASEAIHMSPGAILAERYRIGKVLGFGGFGVTYLAWDMVLECKMAIKEYLPSEFSTRSPEMTEITVFAGNKEEQFLEGMQKFVDEAKKLAKFQSEPGIVKIYDSFMENNTAYIVMEYLEGETLSSIINKQGKIPADISIGYLTSIIQSLENVHGEGIIHRDIAPDNIMVTKNGEVKLIDFGAARYATTSHSRSLTVIIKPGYSPEEQYRSRGDQGPHTDVYATAAVMYRMITGVTPPDAMERRAYFENGKKDILELPSKYDKGIPENVETAILNAMNVRIEDRTPDMATFFDELTSDESVKRRVGKIKKIDVLRWPLWLKLTVPTAIIAIVTLITLFALGIIGTPEPIIPDIIPDGMTRVVSVVNDDLSEAEDRIKEAMLQSSILKYQIDAMIPADTVMYQSGLAGSIVAVNTMLNLTVSKGAEKVQMLGYQGMNVNEVIEQLEADGFIVQKNVEYSNTVAEGCIIDQSVIEGNYVEYGSLIILTVSLGREDKDNLETKLINVPNFVGKDYADVLKEAEELGLMISVYGREYSSEYPENVIMTQSIKAGEEIINDNILYITVSRGIQSSKVPDVFGLSIEDAQELIEGKGFVVTIIEEENEKYAEGVVFKQTPEAEEELATGEIVYLTVSSGAKSFSMEDLSGMTEEEAINKIIELGLSANISYEHLDSVEVGKIISFSPKSGEQVKKGDSVSIVVCTAEELIDIPDLSNKTAVEAGRILKGLGLEITQTEVYSDTIAEGLICGQVPESGKKLKKGGTVVINVSKGKEGITLLNYTGKTESVVKDALEKLKLKVKVSYDYSDTVASGAVISMYPTSGKIVYEGDEVLITISKGKAPITLGDYTNKSAETTKSELEGLGLSVCIQDSFDDKVAKGNIISTNPVKGSTVYKGDMVVITVSQGVATVPVTGITLNKTSLSLTEGLGSQLIASIIPENASDKKYTFTSSNDKVATVSSNGLVTAVAVGSATITVTTNNGNKKATCEVKVEKTMVEKIELSTMPTKLSYYVGDVLDTSGLKLKVTYNTEIVSYISEGFTTNASLAKAGNTMVTVTYEGKTADYSITIKEPYITVDEGTSLFVGDKATIKAVVEPIGSAISWTSSNSSVVSVDNGVVTGVAKGQADITAIITYNGKSYSSVCKCIVGDTGVVVDKTVLNLYIGDTQTISALTNPSGQSVIWASENTAVATVSNGVVTAVGAGKTNIVVSMTYGGISYTSKVEVNVTTPSISLTKNSMSVYYNNSDTVSATTVPAGQKVTWSSSNSAVVSVNNGTVTGVSSGNADVTCSFMYAGKTYSSTLSVEVQLKEYTVYYHGNGGCVGANPKPGEVLDISETVPETLTSINANNYISAKKGYKFEGWYTDAALTNKLVSTMPMPSANLDLYAKFSPIIINVTLMINDGSDKFENATWTYNETPNWSKPSREGYDFVGWSDAAVGGNLVVESYYGGILCNYTDDMVLYASWQPKLVQVNFDYNGGKKASNSGGHIIIDTDEVLPPILYNEPFCSKDDLPVPVRDYYSFDGWYTAKEGGQKVDSNIICTELKLTIYAHWTPNTYNYTRRYYSTNNTILGSDTVSGTYGQTYSISPQSTFGGYNTPAAQSIKWDAESKNIDFYFSPSNPTNFSTTVKYANLPDRSFTCVVEYRNRTENSVEIRATWTSTKSANAQTIYYEGAFLIDRKNWVNTPRTMVVDFGEWDHRNTASKTVSSEWLKVNNLSADTTSIPIRIEYYQYNYYMDDISYTNGDSIWTSGDYNMSIPKY